MIRALFLAGLALIAILPAAAADLKPEALSGIKTIVEGEIRAGHLPGAVVVVGQHGRILYREAFGVLSGAGDRVRPDTIYDLASLTKAVATTTAVLQLVEAGQLDLAAPVSRYWPEFASHGKGAITVGQLLAHSSGLRADLDLAPVWSGEKAALKLILAEHPVFEPGSRILYSDINFEVLGELVGRVSGERLDRYGERHLFAPLGMKDTRFLPPEAWRERIAPTGFLNSHLRRGEVHDPSAYRMGGVAGHAGLFSTADDLARFARALLAGGILDGRRILKPETVAKMSLPQLEAEPPLRGLGWRLEPPLVANREFLPAVGALGHYGYTGTALWIDPVTDSFVVVLSNRVHPDGKGDAKELRWKILALISAAQGPLEFTKIAEARPELAPYASLPTMRVAPFASGLDVLADEDFSPLAGLRVGLITNQTGVDGQGRSGIDLLRHAPGLKLAAIFSPEHGLLGRLDQKIPTGTESVGEIPVQSLYGKHLKPTPTMLAGLDALVFDIQDAGARFYTYISTMGYAMEAAAAKGIPFFVLDRPNPLTGEAVQGPLLDSDQRSFTGYFPLPVRHGMTVGELAGLFNAGNAIGAKLTVIRMRGYLRREGLEQTGRTWLAPSPNLRSATAAHLYPGVGLVEGANLSVGRGTPTPFEVLGAPWVDGDALARRLNARQIPGVRFEPTRFTPTENRYRNQLCHGVRLILVDRKKLDSPELGIELAHALLSLFPAAFHLDEIAAALASRSVMAALREGRDPRQIAEGWQAELERFRAQRQAYLLYR